MRCQSQQARCLLQVERHVLDWLGMLAENLILVTSLVLTTLTFISLGRSAKSQNGWGTSAMPKAQLPSEVRARFEWARCRSPGISSKLFVFSGSRAVCSPRSQRRRSRSGSVRRRFAAASRQRGRTVATTAVFASWQLSMTTGSSTCRRSGRCGWRCSGRPSRAPVIAEDS